MEEEEEGSAVNGAGLVMGVLLRWLSQGWDQRPMIRCVAVTVALQGHCVPFVRTRGG